MKPAKLNDKIYRPVDPRDPTIIALSGRIQKQGLLEPIVATLDKVILSGHRRHAACKLAGLHRVAVRWHDVYSTDPEFAELLVAFNDQRSKTADESIREQAIQTSRDGAFERLARDRSLRLQSMLDGAAENGLATVVATAARRRAAISTGKQEMLAASVEVLDANRRYWPLSIRQVHYRLLNNPPSRNTDPRFNTGSYQNDRASYQDLSDLMCRARLAGFIEWAAISDDTRPVSVWQKWQSVGGYVREQLDSLFGDFRRDLLQSQASHIELVAEKMTVSATADRVASEFRANVMIGRGFSSITAKHDLVQRFKASGKDFLVLLIVTDFDPSGETIAENLAASIRDEFGVIEPVEAHRVALTAEQVRMYGLPPGGKAKKDSPGYAAFVRRFGDNVYELEALEPAQLESLIRDAFASVLDHDMLRNEQAKEVEEQRELERQRQEILEAIGERGNQ
ncbi:MAG TPA: ParB N-terminal domain-containing protein [Gemmataceae bacterium]|nr:ParB N-terminal domain-containing protein [Gemmataceae bacterium]